MALHIRNGQVSSNDVRQEPIHTGTLGGEHMVPKSISAKRVTTVVDDSDPRVQYGYYSPDGATSGSFSVQATTDFTFGGTQTVIGYNGGTGSIGSAALFNFTGTSIAVLGGFNPHSGNMRVFIDGVETAGRVPTYTGIRLGTGGSFTNPVIHKADLTIPALAQALAFTTTGTLYLNGELITYTSRDANGFYGCTRGAFGTPASDHNANETIYQWNSIVNCYPSATDYSSKQVLYYNPLLAPGAHNILIIAEPNTTSGYSQIFFDGFVTGALVGASNLNTQIATITVNFTTDANGHADIGGIVAVNNDVSRLAFLGYTQLDCETSSTNKMGVLGIKYSNDRPFYYCHNGPASTAVTWTITFAFVGETL